MRLALNVGYSGTRVEPRLDLVREADRLGYDSVWVAEAYGSDAVSMLAWYGALTERIGLGSAIMQIPARTPAMTAMTAATLADLSGGRFRLGLGMSGPQVVEGWHGRPYGKPLQVTREYIAVVRAALERERPLRYEGEFHRIPYDGPGSSGLGKPLKLTLRPEGEVPIYLAAIGPRNVALAAEIADGWLPFWYSPERGTEVFGPSLEAGFAASGDPTKRDRFDVLPTVPAALTDDLEQARWGVRPLLALYVGGMGARGKNFYFDLMCRYGYEEVATRVQDAYLEGRREEAMAALPDELVDEVALLGDRGRLADRLAAWEESGVTTLAVAARDADTLRVLAELVL
ncbi:MAG: LLM class F420-dependent oxidoreductase [Acidimicrobiia bacterium]|nr:MAG: LLM class F420-dependent oxidoreductase [Acidimicrobiia bacterium]